MTAPTTPPPAEETVQQAATTALPQQNPIDPGLFVPEATRQNYLGIIRDQAAVRGSSPESVRDELVGQFRTMHDRQPLDGYDHLSAWLASADVAALSGATGMQTLVARTLESARRDPQQAVQGDQALVEQGVLAQQNRDEQVAAAATSPTVDPSSGLLPNPGPLPTPTDVATADPAVAEQQQAAQAKTDEQGTPTQSATPSAEATSSGGDGGSSGKSSGKGSSGGSGS
jgi:hypothetical protein